jgi:hypothetical protein
MKRFATVMPLAILLFGTLSRAEEQMSMETTWDNVPQCVGRLGQNASMTITHAPRGTKFISAELTSGMMEMGGERVPFPENGVIPKGTVHTLAPCNPGTYRWTINAEDAQGRVLSTIQKNMLFPAR